MELNDIILNDIQYLKNAPSLPFSALSVKDCQAAAVPLDSNQAQKKNELFCCALTTAQSEPLKCPIHHLLRDRHTVFLEISPQKYWVTSEK